jgi:HAD superfamily hydrolase (TIGR01549 family)
MAGIGYEGAKYQGVKCLIFDFDGTLADTYRLALDALKAAVKKRGMQLPEDVESFRDMSLKDILRKYNVSWKDQLLFAREYRKGLEKRMDEVKTFLGMKETLVKLSKKYRLGVLTSNSVGNVKRFLNNNGLESLFDFVESGIPMLGKHRRLKRAANKHGYKNSEVIYVADEARDIEAAKKAGIGIVAVSWGFNSESCLRRYGVNDVVTAPEQLLELLK